MWIFVQAIPENTWDNVVEEKVEVINSEPQTLNDPFLDRLFKVVDDFVTYAAQKRKNTKKHTGCATRPYFTHGEHVQVHNSTLSS
jgi:hypothetical protein